MIASSFLELVDKYKFTDSIGLEDVADKFSFIGSVSILLISAMIVTLNTLVFSPLACFSSVTPSGLNYDKFVENYCWLEGTYGFLHNETIPKPADLHKYDHLKIGYYQWIPFVLAFQCAMFYLPRIIWQTFCYSKIGIDLEGLIERARNVRNEDKCIEKCQPIAKRISSILYGHRDYRQGGIPSFRRKLYTYMGVFIASKRLGTWLVSRYFVMKLMYFVNAIMQLVLLNRFLQSDTNFVKFGYDLVRNTIQQRGWIFTRVFPQVSYCFVKVKVDNSDTHFVSQCSLPQNMLNEKIFAFIYFWIGIVTVVTILGVFVWIKRISYFSRVSFVRKSLDLDDNKGDEIEKFTSEFLQHDGYFITRMIYSNAGDIVTTAVMRELFDEYEKKYNNVDFRKDPYYKVAHYNDDAMAMRLGAAASSAVKRNDTAPTEIDGKFV